MRLPSFDVTVCMASPSIAGLHRASGTLPAPPRAIFSKSARFSGGRRRRRTLAGGRSIRMPAVNEPEVSGISLRNATSADAQAIGAVFDASVRVGWSFLGDPARQPLFSPDHWDQLA